MGKGHASICHSCQLDILKQEYQNIIYCASCSTKWENSVLKHKKTAAYESMGLPCHACGKGTLMQQYANVISCDTCGTKWTAYRMKGYSKRAQQSFELNRGY